MAGTHRDKTPVSSVTPGAIHSIRLQDFMAYRDVLVTPGAGFNMVIGPNGSGKSSIVAAITVGLGGDISELKRQHSIADLVNTVTNASRAKVTIQLFQVQSTTCMTVECTILRSGGIDFLLNDQPISQEALRRMAEDLGIQTNNLCQFLPQDVVRDFPEMPATDKLLNTMRAVGDTKTLNMLHELKLRQVEYEQMCETCRTKQNTVSELASKCEGSAKVRTAIEERKDLERLIGYHGLKQKLSLAKALRCEIHSADRTMRQVRSQQEDLKQSQHQLKKKLEAGREIRDALVLSGAEVKHEMVAFEAFMNSEPTTGLNGKIRSLTTVLDSLASRYKSKAEKVDQLGKEIQQTLQALATITPKTKSDQDLGELSQKHKTKFCRLTAQEHHCSMLVSDLNALERRATILEGEKQRLRSEDTQKVNILRQRNPDTLQGMEWLHGNRDRFNHAVHDPIMICLKVREPADNALYLERLVGAQDLQAFVCEDAGDANKLMNILRGQERLKKINVVTSQRVGGRSALKSPACSIPGFKGYVVDMITCPEAVRDYLCLKKGLHGIPVFETGAASEQAIANSFKRYFVGKKYYETRKGRYSSSESVSIEDYSNDRTHFFPANCANDEELRENTRQIERLKGERQGKEQELDKVKSAMAITRSECGEVASAMSEIKTNIDRRVTMEWKLQDLQEQQELLKKSSDVNSLRQQTLSERSKCLKLLMDAHKETNGRCKLYSRAIQKASLVGMQIDQAQKLDDKERTALSEVEAKMSESNDKIGTLETKRNQKKATFHATFDEIKLHLEPGGKLRFKPEVDKAIQESCSADLVSRADVLARIETLKQAMKALPSFTKLQEDNAILHQERLAELTKTVKGLETNIKMQEIKAAERAQIIIRSIDALISKIDLRFSEMMAELGHAGSIRLSHGAGPTDFQHYGLEILVNFSGSKGSMECLSGSVQSGGEKSVTIAVYMMALQELTRVPFRCVDEINQGMDEINERRIWKMLLATASKYTAQYIYFSPKFPRELDFGEDLTVIFCFNGAVRNEKALGYSKVLRRQLLKKRKIPPA